QISTIIIGVLAIVIAINPFDSVFWLAVFAWAGLATCFGPPVVLSLYWKGVTKWGAISGMLVGPIVTILWYMWPPLDIYEGGPAFLAALAAIVIVSLLTKAPKDDQFEAMWSSYNEKNAVGTPSFMPDEYEHLKNMQNTDLCLRADKHIVRDFIAKKPLLQVHLGSYERAPHLDEVPGKTRINLIETPYNLIDKDIVCYPNLVLYFKCRVFRLFMKPRIVYSAITVDLVKGNAARANMFPNCVAMEISESALIPRLIDNTAGVDAAAAVTLKWLRHRYKVYNAPDIAIMKQKEVYKAFFYIQDERNQDVLVDSIEGIDIDETD